MTGAAKRIGRAIALGLAEDGWDVCIHYYRSDSDAERVACIAREFGVTAACVKADLRCGDQVANLIARCSELIGPLTCLINNASLFEYDSAATLTVETWDSHQSVNLRAPILLARDFAAQVPTDESGCVINLLDQKVFNLNPDFFSYTVAKVGLEAATRMLALALAPRVRVCGIAPGLTLLSGDQTPENFAKASRVAPLGASGDMADVVATVRYLLNTPSITGQTICVDGGQRLIPLDRDVMFKV